MRRLLHFYLVTKIVIIFTALALIPACLTHAQCLISVGVEEDPPYTFKKNVDQEAGLDVEVIQEASRRINCRSVFQFIPFARAIDDLKSGRLSLLPGIFRTPERETFAVFTKYAYAIPNRYFFRREDLERFSDARTYSDLIRLGARIGIMRDNLPSGDFADIKRDPAFSTSIFESNSLDGLWQMLAVGRIDVVIYDELAGRWHLRQLHLDDKITSGNAVPSSTALFFGFSRKSVSPEIVERFDQAITRMKMDGTLAQIFDKYGVKF